MLWKSIDIEDQNTGRIWIVVRLILAIYCISHSSKLGNRLYVFFAFSDKLVILLFLSININIRTTGKYFFITVEFWIEITYFTYFSPIVYCRQSEYLRNSWYFVYILVRPPSRGDILSVEDFIFKWTREYKMKPFDICGLTNAQCKMFWVYVQCVNIYL